METEDKLSVERIRRARRRERAHQLQDKPRVKDEMDDSPPRTSKDKGRPKPRKPKNSSNSYEEDIIDGFAIISFKSLHELENSVKAKNIVNNSEKKDSLPNNVNCEKTESNNKQKNTPSKDKSKQAKKKGKKNPNSSTSNNKISRENNCLGNTGCPSNNKGPSRSTSRDRLSDGSTHSSRGYLCDSERSEDERASDAGSELFNAVSVKRENNLGSQTSVTPPINYILPVSSPAPSTITTTTTISAPSASATTVTTATCTATTSSGIATTTCTLTVPQPPSLQRPFKSGSPSITCLSPVATLTSTTPSSVTPPPSIISIPPPKRLHSSPTETLPSPVTAREPPKISPINNRTFSREEHNEIHKHKDHLDFVKNTLWNRTSPLHNSVPSHNSSQRRTPPLQISTQRHSPPSVIHNSTPSAIYSSTPKHISSSSHNPTPKLPSPSLQNAAPKHSSSHQSSAQRHTSPSLHHSTPSHRHTTPSLHSSHSSHKHHPSPPSHHPATSLNNSTGSLHNPLSLHNSVAHRSPGLPSHTALPLHSPHRSHHSSPYPTAGPHPPPQPLHAHSHPAGHHPSPQSMFAAPHPPPPAALTSASLPVHASVANPLLPSEAMPFHRSQELQQELNRRFLESHIVERSPASTAQPAARIPYLRQDIHQHQHMHQHQHTHQHTYGPLPSPHQYPGSLVPTPSPHMFEKMPKFDSPFYRQNPIPGIQSYPVVPSHPSGPGPLNSGSHGAFQPKKVTSGMHPSQMMLLREREKNSPSSAIPASKKPGKWCAMHVRVAWEIYHHQQKQQAEAQKGEGKQMDPLRPSGHLMGGMHRPPDLTSASLLGAAAHNRSPFDGSFLSPLHLAGVSSYPRPFPGLPPGIGFGPVGNGFFSPDRPMPGVHIPGVTPPQEWNRLHRTPPSFPTPPAWPKPDAEREREKEREREREKEKEREREREKERDRERQKERERERDREISANDKRLGERERDRHHRSSPHHERHSLEMLEKSRDLRNDKFNCGERSRSRSRSPLRNGRPEHLSRLDPMYLDKPGVKVKEERSDEEMHHHLMQIERDKMIQNEYLMRGLAASHPSALGPVGMNLMERSRMLAPPYGLPPDRVHPGMWNPMLDKGLDINNHRLELQRELEREKDKMMARFNHPLGAAMMEHDQRLLKEQEFIRAMEGGRREYMGYFPQFERERLEMDRSKMQMLRDPLSGVHQGHRTNELMNHAVYHRANSPFVNHHGGSKNGSPATIPPGAPPPLIPSLASAAHGRSHTNSPMNKSKTCSPADINSEAKDRRETSSTDPELHSR